MIMQSVWATGLLVFLISCGQAIAKGSGASDNELYAAYCIGFIQSAEAMPHGKPSPDPKVEEDSKEMQVANQRLLGRLYGYLAATGILTDPARKEAMLGIRDATNRGVADHGDFVATVTACLKSSDGAARPLNFLSCLDKDPVNARSKRCFGPDNLPFQ